MADMLTLLDSLTSKDKYIIIAKDRKEQVGSGMRGDKTRTYRFQDDTVKDHISGRSAKASIVLSGRFDLLWV